MSEGRPGNDTRETVYAIEVVVVWVDGTPMVTPQVDAGTDVGPRPEVVVAHTTGGAGGHLTLSRSDGSSHLWSPTRMARFPSQYGPLIVVSGPGVPGTLYAPSPKEVPPPPPRVVKHP